MPRPGSTHPSGESPPPRLTPADLLLFAEALRLTRRAQRVRGEPLEEVVRLVAGGGLVAHTDLPQRAALAANRAGARGARWFGWLNTCLTKSLTAGGLLATRRQVVLHVGFRPGSEASMVDGHAWLGVDGKEIQLSAPPDLGEKPYTGILEIPFDPQGGRT